jgi:WD40 repeat protein
MRILMTVAACAFALAPAQSCPAQAPRQVFTEAHYPGYVSGMAFSPDGKRLASVGLFGGLQVRDLASGKRCAAQKAADYCVTYHPDGKLMVTGGRDGTVTLRDADSAKPRKTLKGHTEQVWALSFSSDGKLLASASSDKTVKVWDVDKAREKATLRHPHYVYSVAFLKGDKLLASGSDAVRLWDIDTAREVAALKKKGVDEVSVLAVSPDGKTLACAIDGELTKPRVIFWEVRTRQERPGPDLEDRSASSLAFSPDGTMLAVGVPDQAVIWGVGAGKKIAVLEGHYGPADPVSFSPDGRTVATGDCETTIRLWDLKVERKPVR